MTIGDAVSVRLIELMEQKKVTAYRLSISRKAQYGAYFVRHLTAEEIAFVPVTGSQTHFLQEIGADRNAFKWEKW